ncbi:MAG: precorrin-6A/cobalt-precorrin-6A reductase, partial [Clostridia bacterium]|nr:precorrin-6A/cobalt-precorrin-6A reductase [Clostridia bacterium]
MKDKICIFAGTTEGRKLAALLCDAVELTICVATEYGEVLLDGTDGIAVHTGRMDADEMKLFFEEKRFCLVIDATHPYAATVTENIAVAAKNVNLPLMRILRETQRAVPDAVYVDSVGAARDYLQNTEGNILLTTGSKELAGFTGLDMDRVWARVLPLAASLEACAAAGVPTAHIIA